MKWVFGFCLVAGAVCLVARNADLVAGEKSDVFRAVPAEAKQELLARSKKRAGLSEKDGRVEAAIQYAYLAGDAPTKAPAMPDLDEMMDLFRNKAKKGEGLHAELHYHPKIKNQDGIEALIGALATKKLTDENVAKVSKELNLLGYRVAAMGSLTHGYKSKDKAKWEKLSIVMRDSSFDLAQAAAKKDGEGILAAAKKLEASCVDCHKAFR